MQEAGIDEPDIVKLDSRYMFVARSERIEMIALPGLEAKDSLAMPGARGIKLFLEGDKLVTFAEYADTTRVAIHKISSAGLALAYEHRFQGYLVSARLSDGQVLTVTQTFRGVDDDSDVGIPCENLMGPVVDDFSNTITGIHRIDLARPARVFSSGQYGNARDIYVTAKNLYMIGHGYTWFFWDARTRSDDFYNSQIVVKYDWRAKEGPKYLAAGAVYGELRNQFSFHEKSEKFYVATSFWRDLARANRLWVLEQDGCDLSIAEMSDDFGHNEDIRAVRFLDDKAYVVTFERTDPLFAFDLSEGKPRLMSRLEVPGFSAYLHPIATGATTRLLGVGYDADDVGDFSWLGGVKLSLFDVSDPAGVREIDAKVFGARFSHTDVSVDHHAFTEDRETGLVALPVRLLKPARTSSPWDYAREIEFSGAFVINPGASLEPVARLTHWEWLPDDCRRQQADGMWWSYSVPTKDVSRVVRVGENFASVSIAGVKLHSPEKDFAVFREIRFTGVENDCADVFATN